MDIIKDNSRYSRSDLLALRYEGSARQRPSCANRTELQTLNFWKIIGLPSNLSNSSGSNNNYGSKSGLSPERERERDRERDSSSLTSSNGMSSRRALRNRERAHNYYQRFTTGDQIGGDEPQPGLASTPGSLSGSYKSPNIDHRSISSAHLMPAFAKRRFVFAYSESNESQNDKSNALINNEDGKEIPTTPTQLTADQKSHIRAINSSLGSPIRRSVGSAEWDRSHSQDNEQLLALSPTFLAGRQGGSLNVQERRIGSGRLLPRNDNWEFKNKDSDPLLNNLEKDRHQNGSLANQQRQRTSSGKHSERLNDNLGERDRERDRDRDRRVNERKGPDNREQIDGKKSIQTGRRTSNKDKFNFGDSSMQGRGKRMYQSHDRHEPEWFSAGPTSQHETIDLHGFEDYESESPSDLKVVKEEANKEIDLKTNQIGNATSRSSSVASLNVIEVNSNKKDSDEMTMSNVPPNKRANSAVNPMSKSEVEFNFDAFLNMDPMDHALMGNDSEVQGDAKGTSRFSQWFASKEPTKSNDRIFFGDSSTPDTQEIPSVKDLEARMRKVDMRPEYEIINSMTNAHQSMHTEQRDKSVTRDTEAFKRLLQQLGSQNNSHPGPETYPMMTNVPAGRSMHNARPNSHERPQHMARVQDCQIKEDDAQIFQHRPKKNDSLPQRHMEMISQNQVHPAMAPGVHDANISGFLPLQAQKRLEIQHLLQGVVRGEVSVDFLGKEMTNPNTAPHTREILAAVLYEYFSSGRDAVQQNMTYPSDINHHNPMKNHQFFNKNVVSEDFFIQNTPSQGINQHLRHSNSPTPLAFTPTSVLRKMTADKETTSSHNNSGINQQYHQYQLPTQHPKPPVQNMMNESPVIPAINQLQPRMILGGNYAMQHQLNANSPQISPKLPPQMTQSRSQPNKWPPGNMQASHGTKSFGRPILKGTLNSGSQQMPPLAFLLNNDMQMHQQKMKSMQPTETINSDNIHVGPPPLQNVPYTEGISQMQQHHFMQQPRSQPRHRILHGDMHRQTNMPVQTSASMPGGPEGAESTNLMKNNSLGPINYHRDERLSPTTNQLAQWFSPELLARASAGKLPLLNMNQALSLEEFERSMQHSSATVLN